MYRRKRHDNDRVAATDESLRRVCTRWNADVDVKQRVADVLDIDALSLGKHLRWYALSSHFDFVVWRGNEPQFAVEFDERHHFTDPEQLVRDEKKNAICASAHFPLLRIEDASLRRIGGTPVVEWLADLFFVYHQLWLPARHGWDEAEGFDPADWDDDLHSQIRGDDFSYVEFLSARPDRGVPERAMPGPFDPFHDARRVLTLRTASNFNVAVPSWFDSALGVMARTARDPQGRDIGHVAVPVGADGVVIGSGRCWNPGSLFCGDPNLGSWIAVDLAGHQAADFLDLYDRGRLLPTSWDEAERRLRGLEESVFRCAILDQQDHRDLSYRQLRRMGMDHVSARRAAYSLRWDDEGRLIEDDVLDDH